MKRPSKKRALLAMTLGALVIGLGAARADDTAEEIRLLKAQLRKLEDKVNEQARKQKETQVQIRNVAAQPAPAPVGAPYGAVGVAIAPLRGSAPQGLTAVQSALRGLPVAGAPSLYINGVSITPGGFLALEGLFRDRFIGADIATPFQNIPFAGNTANGHAANTNEFRFSARQSRASVLVKGDVDPATHLAGWAEFDFLGAAQTANSNESNSYNPRVRNLYLSVDQDDFGAHLLAGQNWSLVTMTTQGITQRKENSPLTIDAQYVPGFAWARQPQIRVVKDFDKTFWVALSAENPTTNATAGVFPTFTSDGGIITTSIPSAVGGSLFNNANAISLNHAPDVIGKIAWDPNFGDRTAHFEAFGLFRDFYDRVSYNGTLVNPYANANAHNNDAIGGGFGGSILLPLLPKQLDLQFSGMTGRGIGRYGSAQLSDVTFNSDGTLSPIPETMLLAGLTWHATPQLDFYGYAGEEFENSKWTRYNTLNGTVQTIGLGNPYYLNNGCFEGASLTGLGCTGNIKKIQQITAGFWDKIYEGPFGQLRAGVQYSFTQKYAFPGVGGAPKAQENMIFTSLRYYPF